MKKFIIIVFNTLSIIISDAAFSQDIAIVGTGRMGQALGERLQEIGHRIHYGSRTPNSKKELLKNIPSEVTTIARAIRSGDIIILAVPWLALEGLANKYKKSISTKIIIDVTNAPLRALSPENKLAVGSSAGELLQQWLPQARVVKAFNTVGYHIIRYPKSAQGPVTVPIVGNDEKAKLLVARLTQSMGFETSILGNIKHAHTLEGMANLYFTPYAAGNFDEAFEYYFRKGTAPSGLKKSKVRQAN